MIRLRRILAINTCLLVLTVSGQTEETTKTGIQEAEELTVTSTSVSSMQNSLEFATGFEGGTYFKVAAALASMPGMKMRVRNSRGSIENIKALRDNKAQIAMAQLDILIKFALKKSSIRDKVKILMPLYNEEVHVIAKRKIRSLEQLEDRLVAIGPRSSGTSATARIILGELGNVGDTIRKVRTSTQTAQKKLLQRKGELSAMFIVAGAPVELLSSMPRKTSRRLSMVPIGDYVYKSLIKQGMPYTQATIKKKTYPWLRRNVDTLAVGSAIIVSADVSNADVYAILKTIFANRDRLKKKHRKWREFDLGLAKFYMNAYAKYFHPAAQTFITNRK